MASSKQPGGTPGKRLPKTSRRTDAVSQTLTLIRTSFPGRDELITSAFRSNRPFRELCEDYRRCVAALHRWRRLEEDQPRSRGEEYSELLVALGAEIQTWLEAMDAGSNHPDGRRS